jgi:4-amino-4-deoxy-L-arabinose transferase-like glycosyltransferase
MSKSRSHSVDRSDFAKPPRGRELEAERQAAWWWSVAVAVVLGVYLALFFTTPLADLPLRRADGSPLRRIDLCIEAIVAEAPIAAWFDGVSIAAVGERFFLAFTASLYLAVAAAAGWMLLRFLRVDQVLTRLERSLMSVAAGLNVLSLFTLLAGVTGLLNRATFFGAFAIIGISAIVWRVNIRSHTNEIKLVVDRAGLDRRWLWLLVPIAMFTLLAGMMIPLDFDVREYHLQAPKEFFQNGRISFLPHNIYANMPLGAEMHALAATVLTNDWWWGAMVGKTVLAALAPLTALALFAFGERFFSRSAGIVAAIVYLATPWVLLVSTSGLIDGTVALYVTCAVFAAALWWRTRSESGMAALTGWFVGAAVACKYPAVLFVAVPISLWLVYQTFRAPTSSLRPLFAFLLAAAVACAPWFLKNLAVTGNPTYPLLYNVFGSTTRTEVKNEQWSRAHRPPNYSSEDLIAKAKRVVLTSEWLSPIAIPLALLGLALQWRRNPLVCTLAGYLLFAFAGWWLLSHRIDRFLVPLMPVVAMLAGAAVVGVTERLAKFVVAAALGVATGYGLLLLTSGVLGDNRFFAPLAKLRAEPQLISSTHRYLNDHRREVDTVLLVGDAEPFDLQTPALYNTCFDDCVFEQLARDRSPKEVGRALAERGVSHVLVRWDEIARYRSPGNYGFTDFVQPELFRTLESADVLTPIPDASSPNSQLYRVAIRENSPESHPNSAGK